MKGLNKRVPLYEPERICYVLQVPEIWQHSVIKEKREFFGVKGGEGGGWADK